MRFVIKQAFLASFLLSAATTSAQTKHPYGMWLGYQLRKPVGKKFSWNNDLQIRFHNQPQAYDYTLIRTALQYNPSEKISVAAGFVYGTDYYEAKSTPVWMNEKRLFQEIRYTVGDVKKLQVLLQFRLEERWFKNKLSEYRETNSFVWRSRYRIDLRHNLNDKWRLQAGDEYMLHFAHNKSSFNQNRIWAGVSRIVGRNEILAQLMQIIWPQPDATVLRINFLHQLRH